jgi:hypothetical protein
MLLMFNFHYTYIQCCGQKECTPSRHWMHARNQDFTLGGALLGEGSGDRLGHQRVQGSARWGDRLAKPL